MKPPAPMRLKFAVDLVYEVEGPTDFVFNIQSAAAPLQRVVEENLVLSEGCRSFSHTDPATGSRYLRVGAEKGVVAVRYESTVDIEHALVEPSTIKETRVRDVPGHVLPYVFPSRYCQSDRLLRFAAAQFGHLPSGYGKARAISEWVRAQVAFVPNSTDSETSACETLLQRQGVCRDFAHLMIALCRASNMPARIATGIDYGADPALGPQDFHAYVEVYVGGRWWIFDPSGTAIPMGFVRIGTGRDAADVAFCTIFGAATMTKMAIDIAARRGADGVAREPVPTDMAISTDDGTAL